MLTGQPGAPAHHASIDGAAQELLQHPGRIGAARQREGDPEVTPRRLVRPRLELLGELDIGEGRPQGPTPGGRPKRSGCCESKRKAAMKAEPAARFWG